MKPSRVLSRDTEWAALAQFVQRRDPRLRLGIVSGRRRVGKSFLIRALAEVSDGLYVSAVAEEGVVAARRRLASEIARYAGIGPELVADASWESLLSTAIELTARRRGVFVIDELPYWMAHSPELPGLLQLLYDQAQAGQGATGGRVIVCGSAMSVMNDLLSGTKALRGRAAIDLRLRPFDLATTARYWGIGDPAAALRVHALLGGAPGYRNLANVDAPQTTDEVGDWVSSTVLDPRQALFSGSEAEYLLREDPKFTGSALHYAIINAVANGATSPAKIGGLLEQPRSSLTRPIDALVSAGYLRHDTDPLWERRPVITIVDPIVRFHNLVTVPQRDLVETGQSAEAWRRSRPTFVARILGPHFESCARAWLRGQADPALRGHAGVVTGTVVNDRKGQKHEIDIVALDKRAGRAEIRLIGEAKATVTRRSTADLDRLDRLKELLAEQGHDAGSAVLALFSMEGFQPDLVSTARRRRDVLLVDLPVLVDADDPVVMPAGR
ncbi:ATP-binding protein [Nonomuraea turkmeniaca]|uniref:ATP-binding protein n=1 Tax=Nonomuraea turkmeniaca TaxID=103838 RepID=A0A5S4FTM1_9ACTN|nr:ATP-binding protein [Nonomuraea turkmeniaca]TMR23972.1 ATP-binding protein [Nonomuraea turkmeniaca]